MFPFHLAISVTDLAKTIDFYTQHFDCSLGRQAKHWVDINFYGHQLSFHLADQQTEPSTTNTVDGDSIRVPHYGLILDKQTWQSLSQTLINEGIKFVLAPKTRFLGEVGEQGTFFINDPSGNTLEFKYFDDAQEIFNR